MIVYAICLLILVGVAYALHGVAVRRNPSAYALLGVYLVYMLIGPLKMRFAGIPIGAVRDVVMMLVVLVLLARVLVVSPRPVRIRSPLNPYVLAFLIAMIVAAVNPNQTSLFQGFYGLRVAALPMVIYLLTLDALRSQEDMRKAYIIGLAMMAIQSILAVFQFLGGSAALDLFGISAARFVESGGHILPIIGLLRPWGACDQSQHLAGVLAVFVVFMLWLRWPKGDPLSSLRLRVPLLALICMALIFTVARTAWAGVFIGLAVCMLARGRWLHVALIAGLVAVSLHVLATLASTSFFGLRIAGLYAPFADQSFLTRLDIWEQANALVRDNPFGFGLAALDTTLFKQGLANPRLYGIELMTESHYYAIAIEMGWFGIATFLLMVTAVLAHGKIAMKRARSDFQRSLTEAALGGFVVLLVMAALTSLLNVPPVSFHFWFIIGLISRVSGWDRGARENEKPAAEAGRGTMA